MEAIPGHKHNMMQTETYLEVLSDKISEVHEATQTADIADAPEKPLFMPTNDGMLNGDLFILVLHAYLFGE